MVIQPNIELKDFSLNTLVVVDNSINLKVDKLMLIKFGYRVGLCTDSRQVMEMIVLSKCYLIYMDIQMPELDGIELTKCAGLVFKNFPQS